MDGSNSIHHSNFTLMKKFMMDVVNSFRVGPSHLQVGVVQFCSKPEDIRQEFYLNTYTNTEDILNKIHEIQQIDQGNSIAAGLNFSKASFLPEHGGRRGKKVLLLFTDGESKEENAPAVADELRAMGIEIFVIGIGRIDTDNLYKIGHREPFIINEFSKLNLLLAKLVYNMPCGAGESTGE